jgi:hypothetical protein
LEPEVLRRFDTDQHVTPFLRGLNTLLREEARQRQHTEHVATIIAMSTNLPNARWATGITSAMS